MTRVIAVYVGQAGRANLAVGLKEGIWGFKEARTEYQTLAVGDILVIGTGYSGGSPRVNAEEWMTHTLDTVHIGVVTQTAYVDDTQVWPDEDGHSVSYPHRFRFDYRGSKRAVPLTDKGPLGQDVSGGLRLSAVNKGWGYVFDDPAGFTLSVPDTGNDPEDLPAVDPPDDDPQPASLSDLLSAFETELAQAGLKLPDSMPLRFLCGLMAKPFVILAGLSGSGKTQLAIALGNWIGADRTWVSAVRPDWTGAEALFGYENMLLPASPDGRAAWTVPAELQFMLRAADTPDEPHILVLDEMNLAHVERYFADVLSGMESAWPVLPNLAQDDDGHWRQPAGADPRIPLPRNLMIVGTVNVDETTYQFSPKVLDRSTTIEFRVSTSSLAADRPDLTAIEPAPTPYRKLLVAPPDGPDELPAPLLKEVHDLHELLADHGREFGHRSYQEMLRFAALALRARPTIDYDEVLDHLVAQKVLPRIHGSARELASVMAALATFVGLAEPSPDDTARPLLAVSGDKLRRMRAELDATHFTAF